MIPETGAGDPGEQKSRKAERLPTEIKGGMMYGGSLLAKRISDLVSEINPTNINEVSNYLLWLRC